LVPFTSGLRRLKSLGGHSSFVDLHTLQHTVIIIFFSTAWDVSAEMLVSMRLGTSADFIARLFSFFFSSGSLKQEGRGR
jgi:hypothetical protein